MLPVFLRFCEGIHAQVTSQRGSGAPGKQEASHWWRYPLVRSILVEATGSPVCFTQVKVTGASPVYFALVEISGKKNLPGLDPRIVQWLATLLPRLSMAKEMKITSFMEVNLMRRSCTGQ